jgi:hypothetical protein
MSAIKLPVRVEERSIYGADDAVLDVSDLVAALNAAPKRAFEDLTARELCTMMEGAEVSEEELLSRLQAFAAPVVPEGWGKFCEIMGVDPALSLAAAAGAIYAKVGNIRAEARRDALEEAAKAAENCDSPFSSATHEQDEAVDLMARRIADTIRALTDRP